jgi:Ca2+-binding RTX toxin-like protein
MTLTANEQYLLELINRARLDPAGEAARFGIGLNDGLSPGTISTASKQVLAPNALLEAAATDHTLWMLAADVFSHTGAGGSSPGSRISTKGYNWSTYGENIAWQGTTGTLNLAAALDSIYAGLFRSAGHRANTLNDTFREVGLGVESGVFTSGGTNYNALMATENFGTSGSRVFLTGLAYTDANADWFYNVGEGLGGVTFGAQGVSGSTASAGGYSLGLTASSAVLVTGSTGATSFSATVDMSQGNVKFDVVGGRTILTSASIVLGTGLNDARLLGLSNLNATGNAAANAMAGNGGANAIDGLDGNDTIWGQGGNDRILGGNGDDAMAGGLGNDRLFGQAGNDRLFGGPGSDLIAGGSGNDRLCGDADADTFQFYAGFGVDTIADFSLAQHDSIVLDDAIWGGAALTDAQVVANFARVVSGGVLLDFGADEILIAGLTTTTGLANHIDVV